MIRNKYGKRQNRKYCCRDLGWRRLLKVPWTARRSSQSILKEINPEYSLEELMLNWNSNTLATWCEAPTHWKRPPCWEILKTGGEGDNRGWDGWVASPTWWTWVWASFRSRWWTGKPGVLQSTGSQREGHDWATKLNRILRYGDISTRKVLRILAINKTAQRMSRIRGENKILMNSSI